MYLGTTGDLIVGEDSNHRHYIPAKHVEIAYWGMIDGKDWEMCSPAYHLTREQAAYILAHYKPERPRGDYERERKQEKSKDSV
jgi:hypothetical protein